MINKNKEQSGAKTKVIKNADAECARVDKKNATHDMDIARKPVAAKAKDRA